MVCSAVKSANVRPQNVIRFMDVQRQVITEIKNTTVFALFIHLMVQLFLIPDIDFFNMKKGCQSFMFYKISVHLST